MLFPIFKVKTLQEKTTSIRHKTTEILIKLVIALQNMSSVRMTSKIQLVLNYYDLVALYHGSYKWIIMLEKCGRPDLTVFHLIWIIGTYGNWKNQNPGGRFGATS